MRLSARWRRSRLVRVGRRVAPRVRLSRLGASAVAANLEEPPKRLTEEAGPMWGEIVQQRYRYAYTHI